MKTVILFFGLILLQNSAFAEDSGFPDTLPDDSSSSPKWLAAVGRMISHTSSTDQEQCTFALLNDRPWKDGIIGVTAGHCVDHWVTFGGKFVVEYNEITFTTNSGKTIKRTITEVLKAEMNPGDYAIVKLNAYIPRTDIQPLLNSPYDFSDIMNDEEFSQEFKAFATVAGFSADKGLGQKGKVMTYHENCKLNGGARALKKGYCYAYEGASGGPVVGTVALGNYRMGDIDTGFSDDNTGDIADDLQLAGTTQHFFMGSIVGGRGGDTAAKTMFTENSHYSTSLDNALAAH